LKTRSGQLWFPTLKGIAVVEPQPRAPQAPAPGVVLEETLIDGVVADQSDRSDRSDHGGGGPQVRVAPGKHRLEFHYTGLSFTEPERVRFRYRLDGLDSSWIEGETRRS